MSNNIPKKLQLKAEILKHISIAEQAHKAGDTSSMYKVMALEFDLLGLQFNLNPEFLPAYKEYLAKSEGGN